VLLKDWVVDCAIELLLVDQGSVTVTVWTDTTVVGTVWTDTTVVGTVTVIVDGGAQVVGTLGVQGTIVVVS